MQLLEQSDQQALRPRMFASFSGRRRTSVCVLGATCVRGPLLFSPVLDIGISVPCRKPSTKESELKKTEGLERGRGGSLQSTSPPFELWGEGRVSRPYICFTMSLGKRSVQPSSRRSSAPSRKSPTKLQSVVQVVPRPILPKPQHRLWHCSPLDDLSKPGSVHDRRPDKRL